MNSFATPGLSLPGMTPPAVSSPAALSGAIASGPAAGGDAALLSGEQFLQMLLGLGGSSAEGAAEALPAVTGTGKPSDKDDVAASDDADEPGEGTGAMFAWLPITAFVASAVPPAADTRLPPQALPIAESAVGVAEAPALPAETRPLSGQTAQDAQAPKPMTPIMQAGVATQGRDAVKAVDAVADLAEATRASAVQMGAEATVASSEFNVDRPAPPVISSVQSLAASVGATVLGADRTALAPVAQSTPTAVPVQQQVYAPVHSPRWSEEMGQRVALMAVTGTQSGSLSLVPEQMGPIEVRIHMNQDTANVWFGASQADTRAAIQDALPRLREMFAATGLSLGEAQVSQQMSQRQNDAPPAARSGYGMESEGPVMAAQPVQKVGLGLLDTYA